jgi:hypothetical protein
VRARSFEPLVKSCITPTLRMVIESAVRLHAFPPSTGTFSMPTMRRGSGFWPALPIRSAAASAEALCAASCAERDSAILSASSSGRGFVVPA